MKKRKHNVLDVKLDEDEDEEEKAKIDALKQAALQLDKLLHSHGITEDELLTEFCALRVGNKR